MDSFCIHFPLPTVHFPLFLLLLDHFDAAQILTQNLGNHDGAVGAESVEIIVKKNNFSAEDVKTIKELVTAELDTSAKNIKIIESK